MPDFEDISLNDTQFKNVRKNRVRDKFLKKYLKVAGTKFKIAAKGRLLERFGVVGQTDFYNQTILIDENITEDQTLVTLFHEMLEAMSKRFYLDIPHESINMLEIHLFQTLIDNPEFLEELTRYAKKFRT